MATKINKEKSNMTGLEGFRNKFKKKASMLKRIEEINAEEQELYALRNKNRQELEHADSSYNNYYQKLRARFYPNQNVDEWELEDSERKKLANHKKSLIALQESLDVTEANINALGEEKNALQINLSELITEMTETDVLEYQEKVAVAQKSVEDIMVIIAKQESLIEAARSAPSLIAELTERKEDILAEIVLGKDLTKELDKITCDIETEKKLLTTREKTIAEAGKSLPGLQRKLLTAKANLKNLEDQKSEILIQYLRCEAEQVGQEYGKAASMLIDKYNRLTSLDYLLTLQGGVTIDSCSFHDFSIPAFQLNAFKSLISPHMPRELVTARMACTRENREDAITREKKRISDLGIEL
jgi:hypothetical protein